MVPDRKKGFGAASIIAVNTALTKLILAPDLEKSEPERGIYCVTLPGGTCDPNKDENYVATAIRECNEEAGILVAAQELSIITHRKTFREGAGGKETYHLFYLTFVDETVPLRTTGFSEPVDGVMMQVVGPPEWWTIDDALRQSRRGSGEITLHKSHQRALCEALIELGERNRDEEWGMDPITAMYAQRESGLRELKKQFQSDEAYHLVKRGW